MKWWIRCTDQSNKNYGLYLVPIGRRLEIARDKNVQCPCKECTNKFFYRLRTRDSY